MNAPFVRAAARAAEEDHSGGDLDVEVGRVGLHLCRGNEHHDAGGRSCRRHRRDEVVRDRRLLPDALRVDDGRLAGDGDRFCQVPDLEVRVDRRREGSGQLDPVTLERVEPGQAEGDRIGAGPQVDDPVGAGTVRHRGAGLFDQHVARRLDRHARQHGA